MGVLALALLAMSMPVRAQSPATSHKRVPAQRPIAGVVTDTEGRPVPGARLWWGSREEFIELPVDKEGRFQAMSPLEWNFVEGPTGLGELWAEADGFPLNSRTVIGGDEQTRPELDVKVKLVPEREPAAKQLRVLDQEGQPIAEAIVELSPFSSTFPPEVRKRFAGRTDSDGRMTLTKVPLHGLYVRVTTAAHGTQDFAIHSSHGISRTRVLQFCPVGRLEVQIGGDAESRRGLRIRVDSDGPLRTQQSSEENLRRGASPFSTSVAVSELGGDGRFQIPAVVASKVFVHVQSPPDSTWLAETPRQFDIDPGTTSSIEIPMTRGIPVSGRVVDSLTGEPVAGISVVVSGFSARKGVSKATATTDGDGAFKTLALPGRASVQVTSVISSDGETYMLPPAIGGPAIQVEANAKEKKFPEIRLTPVRRVIGRVTAKEVPSVQGWRVTVDKLPPFGICDEDGYFLLSVPIGLKPQKYTVSEWSGLKSESRLVSETPLVLEMLGLVPPR
jgi:hypothetical protein